MWMTITVLALFVLALVATGCGAAADITAQPTAVANELPEIAWQRSGGIAGICQALEIRADRAYMLEDCADQRLIGQGQVPAAEAAYLATLRQRYGDFRWESTPPPGSADVFVDAYTFDGNGEQQPSPAEQEALNDFLAGLAGGLATADTLPPAGSGAEQGVNVVRGVYTPVAIVYDSGIR